MHDTTEEWKYLTKNFNDVSAEVIIDKALLRLDIYILAIIYLEKEANYFTKVPEDDKKMNKVAKKIFNLEEKVKKK